MPYLSLNVSRSQISLIEWFIYPRFIHLNSQFHVVYAISPKLLWHFNFLSRHGLIRVSHLSYQVGMNLSTVPVIRMCPLLKAFVGRYKYSGHTHVFVLGAYVFMWWHFHVVVASFLRVTWRCCRGTCQLNCSFCSFYSVASRASISGWHLNVRVFLIPFSHKQILSINHAPPFNQMPVLTLSQHPHLGPLYYY